MSEPIFDNWLHDNAPGHEVYEGSEFSDTWTGQEVRDVMRSAFWAGYRAAKEEELGQ